jgi:hypothetical protein
MFRGTKLAGERLLARGILQFLPLRDRRKER